jgi:hypothetical protein
VLWLWLIIENQVMLWGDEILRLIGG